ncbi:30S ribosomal protein S11 [Candidatus Nomurabacteria bacterium RIFCSPLOWO2_01_FULL_36_10b]|uniref:Small ribosomal subunit protein uS11 n=1 Tax=Candidatus Nomurabacteria bacterium RIFCSPLOWO2_01_FULL_36_10b TaxID=1801766 RepID=A0A1F6WPB1_9BACT|nr:MAG: 30S ribosomal protein S11 [Candidatus Nomurabacteria bacterium RIFCSPLOWO2_01_FULL_36_10b]
MVKGKLFIQATYNNTLLTLSDDNGNVIMSSSSGAIGFRGAKKGTPYAAAKVGELLGEKASIMGLKEVDVIVKGVGSGRESAIRSFISHGVTLARLQDTTPVPHNGVRPRKPRRV